MNGRRDCGCMPLPFACSANYYMLVFFLFCFLQTYVPNLLEMTLQLLLISQLLEEGDNSSYAKSEAREVIINTFSDNSGVNK